MSRESLYLASVAHRARVLAVLRTLTGPENARHIREIAHLAGVPERAARDAYASADGVEFVIAQCPTGLYVTESREEAREFTAKLRSRAIDELARADRRDALLSALEAPMQLGFDLMQRESA